MQYVLDDEVFHGLDEPALDVSRAGGLHGRVNEPLASSHGMEEQLLGGEADQVAILNKPTGLWAQIILGEMRQGAPAEAEGNPLALDILLAHACHHLYTQGKIMPELAYAHRMHFMAAPLQA